LAKPYNKSVYQSILPTFHQVLYKVLFFNVVILYRKTTNMSFLTAPK